MSVRKSHRNVFVLNYHSYVSVAPKCRTSETSISPQDVTDAPDTDMSRTGPLEDPPDVSGPSYPQVNDNQPCTLKRDISLAEELQDIDASDISNGFRAVEQYDGIEWSSMNNDDSGFDK